MKQLFWSALFSLFLAEAALAQTPPALSTFVPAPYPPAAQAAGLEADVLLQITIEITGLVSDVQLLKPAGFGFDEAALQAARQFVFTPALQNGTPTRAIIQYRYKFSLQPKDKKANPSLAPLDNNEPALSPDLFMVDGAPVFTNIIQGVLFEKGSRTEIQEAQIFLYNAQSVIIQEATLITENVFTFAAVPPGEYTIKIIAPGYQTLSTKEKIKDEQSVALSMRLLPSVDDGYGVIVRAASEDDAVTRRVLEKEELLLMPGTQGDVLRALQNIPGVARPPAGAGLLVVRGSSPQDTQVFINGMPVPFLFHITGMTSVIATSMVESIDFQPGVYSALYGRGMGGIIEVKTNIDTTEQTQATWDLGILDLSASAKKKVGDVGIAVAARRSDIDAILPLFIPDQAEQFTVLPKYWDYQASLTGKAYGGAWQVMAFGAQDTFTLSFEDPAEGEIFISSTQRFHRLQSHWEKKIDESLTRRAAVSFGVTNVEESFPPLNVRDEVSLLVGARLDWATRLTPTLGVRYGADFRMLSYTLTQSETAEDFSVFDSQIKATNPDTGLYTEALWQPTDAVTITPGLRLDYFAGSDTIRLEPRAQARWKIADKTSINMGAGIFHEDPRPRDLDPVLGDPNMHPKKAKQVTVGASRSFLDDKLQGDVSLYYKGLSEIVTGSGTGNTNEEAFSNGSKGRVKGAEFLLKYPPRARFFGWVAYSLSKAERQRPIDPEYVPFYYDQRHVLTMLGSYKLTSSVNLGGRFRYSSGVPQTPVAFVIFDSDNDLYLPVEGPRYSDNLPDFHQLDVRVDKTFRFKSWKMSGYLEVLNIYNKKNPETTRYNFDYTQSAFLNGLPITPVIGLRGEL